MKFLALLTLLFAFPAEARDLFVRAGASDGDGSQQKPFADPWQALEKCESGDTIHVAEGKYYGKLGRAMWKFPADNVTMLGGYDKDYKERNPWKHLSQLLWDDQSKNAPSEDRVVSNSEGSTFDGFVIDQQDQCDYQDEQKSGRREKACDSALRFGLPATIKNNIIINPGLDGIVACAGSTIENNLILNAVKWGVVINKHAAYEKKLATVKNNTIIFAWDFRSAGKGGYSGTGVEVHSPTLITENILAYLDNNGVHVPMNPERTSITKNIFFMNRWSNVKQELNVKETVADDKSMDLLDEMGFKSVDGNEIKNPGLALDPKWLDAVSRRTAGSDGKVDMDDWNKARQALGMNLIAQGGAKPSGVAPPYSLDNALKLMAPKVKQGAHPAGLTVTFSAVAAAGPARSYKQGDLTALANQPQVGQAFELIVAIGGVTNVVSLPAQYDQNQHQATQLYDKGGSGKSLIGYYKKGSNNQRLIEEAAMHYQGNGKPDRLHLVKGISLQLEGYPKAAFYIDTVEEYGGAGTAAADSAGPERPQGRDWFVRAGATGGDGSKEKPFKDPWQALEKVEAGDNIHVTEGEYNGKLKVGSWRIATQHIALIGGYDRDFKVRNPWKHPTLLRVSPDLKTYNSDYTIQGDNDHTGAIVDGFVFDRKVTNKYKDNGDLDYDNSMKMQHIWFARPGCIVRNSVFVNGPEHALRMAGGQTIENNIFVNHLRGTVDIDVGFGGITVVRNNTFAFSWEIKFGEGHGRMGQLLKLGTRVQAVVDNNLFAFADNDAVVLNAEPRDIVLTNNTFEHNLWSHVARPSSMAVVDDKSWNTLTDFGWKTLEGNQIISAGLPIEKNFLDIYLNRTAYVPGKVQMDDWNQFREMIGQPMIATGGKAGTGFMPLYDWQSAIALFPKNSKVKSGARAKDFPVQFSGSAPKQEAQHEYVETTWAAAGKPHASWATFEGKRVTMKIVIERDDNSYPADLKKEQWQAFSVCGPEGNDSGGLPIKVYAKKGSKTERMMLDAKSYDRGVPDQIYLVRGLVRANRMMVADSIERAD